MRILLLGSLQGQVFMRFPSLLPRLKEGSPKKLLFWVACSACHGESGATDIINGIWSKFSTGNGPTNLCRRDGVPLKYRDHSLPGLDLKNLIAFADRCCGAWAELFEQALRLQRINNFTSKTIVSIYGYNGSGTELLIENYTFYSEDSIQGPLEEESSEFPFLQNSHFLNN